MRGLLRITILAMFVTVFVVPQSNTWAATTDCSIASNTKCTVTFSYSGSPETFTVPNGVTSIYFDVRGAQGGGTSGGQGGIDTGTLTVASGSKLIIRVGGQGTLGLTATGGYNGGGATSAGDTAPGSGGGASDIRLNADTLTARLIVAGGGGGQSTYCGVISLPTQNVGGAGGGVKGGDGGSGLGGCWAGAWGGGGTQTSGGIKGGNATYANTAGSLGQGGDGRGYSAGGGGGGGGYYGGGGAPVGAGGGGSSFVETNTAKAAYVTSYSLVQGGRTGNGLVSLTYLIPLPTTVTVSSASPISYRTLSILTITSDAPGKFTLFANGKKIAGCIGANLTGVGPTYVGSCNYRPTFRGAIALIAQVTPSDSHLPGVSPQLLVSIGNRTGLR
jgi:hypothetical protein